MSEDLRIKAYELACKAVSAGGIIDGSVLDTAEGIYQWLRYGADGATETRMALAGVTLTDAKTGEARPARVVGRDNDILDRLRKSDGYKKGNTDYGFGPDKE